jgi:hypothetical protein
MACLKGGFGVNPLILWPFPTFLGVWYEYEAEPEMLTFYAKIAVYQWVNVVIPGPIRQSPPCESQ